MPQYKAVLFDLDGTLVNSIADLAASANHALEACGYPAQPVEKYRYFVGDGIPIMLGRASGREGDAHAVARLLPVFMDHYRRHFADRTAAYPGMAKTLASLRGQGIGMAVVTNKAEEMARPILEAIYPGVFAYIYGQRPGYATKPDPALTRLAMHDLAVQPEDCVFLGDSGVDMQTAVRAGAFPAGALWGFRTAEELRKNGARTLLSSPEKLLELTK